jgi:HPt (histidine-containing phosphotransfer) domain-containing protein
LKKLKSNFSAFSLTKYSRLLEEYLKKPDSIDKNILCQSNEQLVEDELKKDRKIAKPNESDLVNSQKFSFEDIVERTGVYEPIFLLKIKKLKKLLNNSEIEKLVQLVNGLAVETNWLTLDNLSDFFNFVNLNVDEIISNRKQELINDEIELIRKDYIHYEFNVDRFSEEEHDETIEKIEESDKEDLWIDHVANVIENESIDLDIELSSLKFDDVNSIDPDIKDIFNEEAQEYLTKLSIQLDRLRENASDTEAILIAEKSASTLKGAAKMLNLNSIGEIASKIERAFETTKFANKEILEENLDKIDKLLKIIKDILSGDLATDEAMEQSQTVSEIINPETDDEMLDIFQDESKAKYRRH